MLALLCLLLAAEPAALERAWDDLAGDDPAKVARATLLLANDKATVSYLKERLRPVKVDKKRLAKLFEQLDADEFEERQKALDELKYLDRFIKDDLKMALEGKYPLEVKARLKELLAKVDPPEPKKPALGGGLRISNINGQITINGMTLEDIGRAYAPQGPPPPPAGWTQASRAAAILEYLGTEEARELLSRLAEGEAEAPPTQAAKAALERWKK
jgi:hypothetical protein